MAENGRVHPACVNAANPYHECGVACLEKIAQGSGRREKKKSGSFILDTALSFGRKKKGYDPQTDSPKAVQNGSYVKTAYSSGSPSPLSSFSAKQNIDPGSSQSFSSSQQYSDESHSLNNSYSKMQVQQNESVPISGKLKPDGAKSPPKISLPDFAITHPTGKEENDKFHKISPKPGSYPFVKSGERVSNGSTEYLNLTFLGISCASEESDEEDSVSVSSDTQVPVGNYHVRANVASTLQSIFDKYGDIAASSKLESTSLRAYHLECLCLVVQELQSTSFKQLTKSKLKEMLAVLKDVESAQIDVSWLRSVLDELSEAMELNNQHQTTLESKTNCDNAIESTRKELDTLIEDLAKKEKAVADTKKQIDQTRERLSRLELESSQLNDDVSAIWSKVENFHCKSLTDEIL